LWDNTINGEVIERKQHIEYCVYEWQLVEAPPIFLQPKILRSWEGLYIVPNTFPLKDIQKQNAIINEICRGKLQCLDVLMVIPTRDCIGRRRETKHKHAFWQIINIRSKGGVLAVSNEL